MSVPPSISELLALRENMLSELDAAEREAWVNLGRYKFWMFGYFAARWVYLNRLLGTKRPNPFKRIVLLAREVAALPPAPPTTPPGE